MREVRGVTGVRRSWALAGLALAAGVAMTAGASLYARAESLWARAQEKRQGWTGGLYGDARARQVGDLVTIIIVERAEATSSASTGTQREGSLDLGPGAGLLDFIPLLGLSGNTEFDGRGRTVRSGSVRAQVTARVVEVLPGGKLRVEGRQTIVINDEEQELVLTGVIRPEDISRENTVLSTYVADARITVRGSGALGREQKPGILTRLFDWLF